jgi:hypothetical protein
MVTSRFRLVAQGEQADRARSAIVGDLDRCGAIVIMPERRAKHAPCVAIGMPCPRLVGRDDHRRPALEDRG